MNEKKQKQLFAAARAAQPVEPPPDFSAAVVRAIAREAQPAPEIALFDQLAGWFPRLATASVVVIIMALAADSWLGGDLASELAEASDQWLLPLDWL